jgi:hypothetical protein
MDYPLPKELSYYNLKCTPQIKIKLVVVKKKKKRLVPTKAFLFEHI